MNYEHIKTMNIKVTIINLLNTLMRNGELNIVSEEFSREDSKEDYRTNTKNRKLQQSQTMSLRGLNYKYIKYPN